MTTLAPKTYQQQVLDSVEAYFKACHAAVAFDRLHRHHGAPVGSWQRIQPAVGLSARHAVLLPARAYRRRQDLAGRQKRGARQHAPAALRAERVLWLVPSKPIREQTLRALRDRLHPYHTALREAGPITVMGLDEARSVTRATLDTSTAIVVATRQAFQVEEEESRKVYQSRAGWTRMVTPGASSFGRWRSH
jgi:type III restriction enzyme